MDIPLLPPLTPAEFYILLALVNKTLEGSGIKFRAESDSKGSVVLKPGTLYEALNRLTAEKLIEIAGSKVEKTKDRRRKFYRITPNGRQILEFEIKRLEHALTTAKRIGLV